MTPNPLIDLPPAVARLDCSGERHTLRWDAGELLTLDHGDPEGERALAALGGTNCACIDVLTAWTRHRDDPRLLSAISRGAGDLIQSEGFGSPPGLRRARAIPRIARRGGVATAMSTGWVSSVPLGPAAAGARGQFVETPETPEEEIALLAGLGRDMTVRMAATVTAALLEQLTAGKPDGSSVRPVLEASLFGRVANALRSWLGSPDLDVELAVVSQSDEWLLSGDEDSSLRLSLPFEWVRDVWGRDLAVVGGRFTLGLTESTGGRITILTVGSDLGPAHPLVIEFP